MCTHDLCFRAKIKRKLYPYKPQFSYIKVGVRECKFHGHVCIDSKAIFLMRRLMYCSI